MTNKILTPREILDLPMDDNDARASTIRDYFIKIAQTVWIEGEGFSGKRPFGNSGWHHEPFAALIKAGLLEEGDYETGIHLVKEALLEL
jgi:hypothetical protein